MRALNARRGRFACPDRLDGLSAENTPQREFASPDRAREKNAQTRAGAPILGFVLPTRAQQRSREARAAAAAETRDAVRAGKQQRGQRAREGGCGCGCGAEGRKETKDKDGRKGDAPKSSKGLSGFVRARRRAHCGRKSRREGEGKLARESWPRTSNSKAVWTCVRVWNCLTTRICAFGGLHVRPFKGERVEAWRV